MATETEIIRLTSNDGKTFEVERSIAEMSATIKDLLTEIGGTDVPLNNVDAPTLEKILEWAKYHKVHPEPPTSDADKYRTDNISDWDKQYMNVDMDMLFGLVMAANWLDIRPLLELGCKTIANMIKGSTPEEVRTKFLLPPDRVPTGASAAAPAASAST